MTKKQKGHFGETIAVKFLKKNGYKIAERNYRFGKSEIDIIAFKGPILTFVEVKLRKNYDFGYPEQHLKPTQVEAIKRAAEHYLSQLTSIPTFIRFDIIALKFDGNNLEINHIQDGFY